MSKLLQIMRSLTRHSLAAIGIVGLIAGSLMGQSITAELAVGSAACTYPVDVLISTSGLTNNTFGSATIDILYNPAVVTPTSPTPVLPLVSPPYTDGFSLLPAACTVGVDCSAVRLKISSGDVGADFGETAGTDITTPFSVMTGLCFTDVPPSPGGVTSKSQIFPDLRIDTTSVSIGFYDSPNNNNNSGVIVDCRTPPQTTATLPFDCTLINLVALPVELTDLSALVDNGDVALTWSTASEENNAGFSVEHAAGESTFEEIAFVEGAGTSLQARTYAHIVKGLDIGTHRFRLKQLDYDGSFEYSEAVEATIELAGTHRLGAAYPNPFNPSTNFELVVGRDQQVKIDIINALGQRVQRLFDGSMEANKPTNFTFQAGTLPTGLYFYRVVGENFAQTRQMLLVK